MKAEELRIGNLVLYSEDQAIFTVGEIDWSGIVVQNEIETTWIELIEFEPIPITEEWLLKFGFGSDSLMGQYIKYRKGSMELWYDKRINTFLVDNIKMIKLYIKYVHQLQNLYFALTGEELKLAK